MARNAGFLQTRGNSRVTIVPCVRDIKIRCGSFSTFFSLSRARKGQRGHEEASSPALLAMAAASVPLYSQIW
jgi:hypothetical protein